MRTVGAASSLVPLVTVDFWRVPRRRVGHALARMATDRAALRGVSGLSFARMLGTGSASSLGLRGADPCQWAMLGVWQTPSAARSFERSAQVRAWSALAEERWRIDLHPLSSRGRWSELEPFGDPAAANQPGPPGAKVAVITRARIAPRHSLTFRRAVPPVVADLAQSDGLLFAAGIGEAPFGLKGTFSLWRDTASLRRFAYGRPAHGEVVRRTPEVGWYSEELFARFAVLASRGTLGGRDPLLHLAPDPTLTPR
ncbi:spheroidene monooxygenase [Frankia sp. AgKG'84/4]|uniref:spheroidene monooxygenase n=1 Tax=Frankia sp. AgKG'84/4 TaxID=573490 RepID=UPI00200E7F11|nr:spheroidene monooxygenase [Frankia sp. AgKG'84/4]MCL9796794.1 spheroidene monooxygenase [Frankia sp. AgKG'84/4]